MKWMINFLLLYLVKYSLKVAMSERMFYVGENDDCHNL